MSGFPKRISLIFPVISVAAIYLVSNLFLNSGHARLFEGLQHGRPYMFADGVTTLRTFYTGLSSLDNYLANLQLIFANVIDGSSLHLALLGLQFGSVIFAVFTVMLTEALLAGRRQDLAIFTVFGLGIQYCGFFVMMPLYCYAHLLSIYARTSSASAKRSDPAIGVVLVSLVVGFVIPSIVMCWPSLSGQSRQIAVAFWQNFPLWIYVAQLAAQRTLSKASATKRDSNLAQMLPREDISVSSVVRTYRTARLVITVVHLAGFLPVFAASILPHFLSAHTPSALYWRYFLIPPKWTSTNQIDSMGEGAWNFLRYDYHLGTMAALLWVAIMLYDVYRTVPEKRPATRDALQVQIWVLAGGPGGALLTMMLAREYHLSKRAQNPDVKKTS